MGEKKDRVTDALNATKAAVEEGIVPGVLRTTGPRAAVWCLLGILAAHGACLPVVAAERGCLLAGLLACLLACSVAASGHGRLCLPNFIA